MKTGKSETLFKFRNYFLKRVKPKFYYFINKN